MGFGGGKNQSSQPQAVDPIATAQAQAGANAEAARETARLNQFNQVNPFGSLTFTGEIGENDRTATTALNPQGQRTFDIQQALAEQLSGLATQRAGQIPTDQFSFDGLPGAPQADDQARQRIEASLLGRLEPQFQRREDAQRAQLANQGIFQGSEAFTNAQGDLDRARNDASLAVTQFGGTEQSRQFGLEQAARQNALQERLTGRALPQNELAALLQGSPAVGVPNFGQAGQIGIQSPDLLGAQALSQQNQLAQFNQANSNQQAGLGGLFGLGSAAITAFSDRKVKKDIKRVGTLDNGLNVYTYRYTFDPVGQVHMGVMADEVMTVSPGAVYDIAGIKRVDYGEL